MAGRQVAGAVALVAASIGVSLLGLEAGLRLVDGVPLTTTDNFVARDLDAIHKEGTPSMHDPRLGWVPIPNASWDSDAKRAATGQYTFGEYGVRMSSPKIVPLQEGATLVVGDSFGAGGEVADVDAWPAQLERMVGTQVINASVGGYGFDQMILRTEELIPRLKPRTLLVETVLGHGLLVSRASVAYGAPKPYFVIRGGKLLLNNDPVPMLAARSGDIGLVRSIFGYFYLTKYVMRRLDLLQWWASPALQTNLVLSNSEAVDVSCLLMRRLADIKDRHDVRVYLVFQYAGTDGTEASLSWQEDRARVMACAEQEKIDVIDMLDPLRSVFRENGLGAYHRLWMMQDNNRVYGHMSAEGNHFVARMVHLRLQKPWARAAQ